MEMRSAIVVGGTGLVGSNLVKLLCESEEYVSVTVIARREIAFEHPKLTVKIRSFNQLEEKDIGFAHEVFCCLGTTIKKAGSRANFEKVDVEYPLQIASLAKKCGIMHFIIISAMGANEKSRIYYNRVKGKLEKELIALELPQFSIVRPSLLVGERSEFRFGEKAGEWVLKVINPLLIGPMKKYRSIEAVQLALAMKIIALSAKKSPVTIYNSAELSSMKMPELQEDELVSRDALFNWDKFKDEELVPIDEEVVFNREKLQELQVKNQAKQ
ncbi:NAD-dependent epimerase/dehydratase family protein [Ureibacillus aquaedulcis]|uniref:NAD(P)H-binding protein n=1 Tax=Ureibacillus aquaedulcis TaxID=3058421 RepID=A0ABT8GKR9_9BACL|nr:NAD-dependent epimerase/dehydratase family protein [Ureibacillus sp. BA0131]MDN4492008.1 NAD(P)H-binding protein [Ureibacillus sp. BA0131]